jgi:type II secretory pathway component GspD/PulD (secretin)
MAMRKLPLLLLACLFLARFAAIADEPGGMMYFKDSDIAQVLDIYQKISGLELVIDPGVKHSNAKITFQTDKPVAKEEALKLLEKVLAGQAHVVITKTDDKHASVKLKDTAPSVP